MDSQERKPGPAPAAARKKGKKKRRRGPPPKAPSLASVLSNSKPIDTSRGADAPLGKHEAAQMRQHLRVLREFRKVLRLKVNAAEDLLLNEVREPTHRGVCQHLLAKVDRASVLGAMDRLDPASATRLLEGVLRFAPEIEYVLLYLEAVKKSASQARATAALSQGLREIDFSQVSSGQMRRVLDLIVELFDARQRPALLLGLLESKTFRNAFDDSISTLPEPLARLVVPLRAVQAAVLHGRPNRHGMQQLHDGVRLLLAANEETLLRHPPQIRRQLFEHGVRACGQPDHDAHRALRTLVDSFAGEERVQGELGISLARHLLASEHDEEARRLLNNLSDRHPDFQLPRRWLSALDAPRIDRFALLDRQQRGRGSGANRNRRSALWLAAMRPVWIYIGDREQQRSLAGAARLHAELAIPNLAPLLLQGVTQEGDDYFAVPNPGQDLARALRRKGGPELRILLRICSDGAAVLGALARAGVRLPDASLHRFELEGESRLWLIDLRGAERQDQDISSKAHIELARRLCKAVFDGARRAAATAKLLQAIEQAADCAELIRVLQLPFD